MDELTLSDFFTILRRWKKVFFITTLSLVLLTLIISESWSNYRATAVVQVEQPEISANATSPNGTNAHDTIEAIADQRISTIEQKVTSTASLIEIITKFDLYSGMRRNKPIALVAENMRKNIKVELISSTLANPAAASRVSVTDLSAIAFKISYDYRDPLLTQQVTDELTTRFLDEDLKERRTQAEETASFLAKQATILEAYLSDQEKKIADYQKEHGISRPDSLAFNEQAAASMTLNLQNVESQLSANEGTLGSLRAQIAGLDPYSRVIADGQVVTSPSVQLKSLQSQYATLSAQYGPDHPDVVKLRHQIEGLQGEVKGGSSNETAQLKAQIIDTRTNLEAARATYGSTHPDVLALQNQLQKLEDQLAVTKVHAVSGNGLVSDADNPAYLQVAAQLRATEEQHKSLMEQHKELLEQQQSYQRAVNENPEVAKEMAALTRDYENAQMRYRELKEKKMTADMDAQMQTDRKGQRLTLINPPEYPLDTHPVRMVLLLGGLFLSIVIGFGVVLAAQTLSGSVVGPRHLESIAGAAPLICIPHILTHEEKETSYKEKTLQLLNALIQRLRQPRTGPNSI